MVWAKAVWGPPGLWAWPPGAAAGEGPPFGAAAGVQWWAAGVDHSMAREAAQWWAGVAAGPLAEAVGVPQAPGHVQGAQGALRVSCAPDVGCLAR